MKPLLPGSRFYAAAKSIAAIALLSSLLLPWASCVGPNGYRVETTFGKGEFMGIPHVTFLLWPLLFAAIQWFRPANLMALLAEILLCLATFFAIEISMSVFALLALFSNVKPEPGLDLAEASLAIYFATAVTQAGQKGWRALRKRRSARGLIPMEEVTP